MKCADYAVWIALKIDGALGADKEKELENHLTTCARCRADLMLQSRIHDALKQEMPSGLSQDFTERVSERALALTEREKRFIRLPDLAPVFGFAVGIILLLVFRTQVANSLVPLMQSFGNLLGAGAGAVGETVLAMGERLPELPADSTTGCTPASRMIASLGMPCFIAGMFVLWSMLRVRAYLRS